MKLRITFCVVLLFIITVNSRNVEENRESEDISDGSEDQLDQFRRPRDRGGNDLRHRRKRWQFSYGYNYPPPPYYDRRDDRNQQDLLPQILALLDEISVYLKRPPPPPPQPIYVPYPVPYPMPQFQQCSCPSVGPSPNNTAVNVTERFPDMEDTNQNWGFVESEETSDAGGDGTRPISFEPIPPIEVMKRPQPSVEHGSSQAGAEITTKNPFSVKGISQSSPPRSPSRCDAAALSCCGPSSSSLQQRKCFTGLGCEAYFSKGDACSSDNVARVLESFTKAYSVVN